MGFYDVVEKRRTIREFEDRPVAMDIIKKLFRQD